MLRGQGPERRHVVPKPDPLWLTLTPIRRHGTPVRRLSSPRPLDGGVWSAGRTHYGGDRRPMAPPWVHWHTDDRTGTGGLIKENGCDHHNENDAPGPSHGE